MVDIERLERINRTVRLIPPDKLGEAQLALRPVKVLFITPSQPIERIAARFLHELPSTVRFVLRPTGALNRSGSTWRATCCSRNRSAARSSSLPTRTPTRAKRRCVNSSAWRRM